MPTTERYQVDILAVVVLIASVLLLVFLAICAIYFNGLQNSSPPSAGESTFLFWTAIVMIVIFTAIGIYALIHLFTHKAVVYEPTKATAAEVTKPPVTVVAAAPKPAAIQVAPAPIKLPPAAIGAQTYRTTPLSTSLSDIPLPPTQESKLQEELLNFSSLMKG